ncbi:MAG: chromosome segregation protein SMC, partial [Bacteroidota bacterium]
LIKDKDNSRRKMLEQAAGISIYTNRKKEARNKLDATEQDLARIEDLIFEINNQLKALENQAKKAEKYHEIKKEYRETSIELAKASLEGFNLSFQELTQQQQVETDRKLAIEAAIGTQEAAIEKEKLALIEEERQLQQLQQAFNEKIQQLRALEAEKSLAQQRLEHLLEKQGSLNDFLQRAAGQLSGLQESIAFSKQQIDEEGKALAELEEQLKARTETVEQIRQSLADKRSALEAARLAHQELQRKQFETEKQVAVADTSVQNLQRAIHQIEVERSQRAQDEQQLTQQLQQAEKELTIKKTDLEQLQKHQEQTKEQILQTQSALEGLRNQLADETRKLDAKRNEYDLLKSMIDSMEGYPESVKFLHNNPAWDHHAPILSDVLYVREEYRTALENVLEPYLSYYVVDDLSTGLKAVQLLDANRKGKANFFLLDKLLEQPAVDTRAGTQPGMVAALDVVEVDPKYRKLAEHLLGQVCIAESEEAMAQATASVVIEKSGKYVRGRYSLTGGSVGLIEGKKIGRAKNLEKLSGEIETQDKIVDELRACMQAKHNEVIAFNEDMREVALRETERAIQNLSNQVFALRNKLENIHALQQSSATRVEELQTQLVHTQSSVADVRGQLSGFAEQIHLHLTDLQFAETAFREEETRFAHAQTDFNEFNLLLTRQQSKIAGLNQELDFRNNQWQSLQEQIQSNQVHLSDTDQSIEQMRSTLQQLDGTLTAQLKGKEESEAQLNQADQSYYKHRNQLQEQESAIRHQVKEREQVEFLLAAIKDKLNELKLQLAGMKERLDVEFKIQLDDILGQERTGEISVEELQEKADRMRKRLENLGEVNPMAVEAFQEMKTRYDFIIEQKTDLVDAKESLLKTIEEVEATANQKFLETYHMVRENFQKVFKTLFTEDDQCDLILENPEDLAETGIDVIAKPKGKRPSSLTQLSGGERTLTATALLFAIYLIKPAPFCILDEVDAPLDDANVGKFTNMIRQFSENSQFIIVTHNKMTMSAVDVIYGVTMQEPGVSKLVSVDFRSLQSN